MYKKIKMPNYVYVLLAIFLILPIIGGHYSFDKVPGGELLDFSGNNINHYDRLIHFVFGLFLIPYTYFLLLKTSNLKNKTWLFILPIALLLAAGAIYEILEWSSALILSPDAVETWVGIKADGFDAQKDMLLGFIGSIISMVIIYIKKKS